MRTARLRKRERRVTHAVTARARLGTHRVRLVLTAVVLGLAACSRGAPVDPLEARPRVFDFEVAPRLESECAQRHVGKPVDSSGVEICIRPSSDPASNTAGPMYPTVECFRLDRDTTERVWPEREGWRLRGFRFAHPKGGLLTLRLSEIRGAGDEFLVFQHESHDAESSVVVASRILDVAGAKRMLLEIDRIAGRRVETLERIWVPARDAPSRVDAYAPGWGPQQPIHEVELLGWSTLEAYPLCCWSWSHEGAEGYVFNFLPRAGVNVSSTASLPPELSGRSMETWPEPVWELRADVRKLGTLEALGETESGRTHFTTPATWSRVPESDLWLKGDGSVHLVTLDAATTEQLLPASEGWSQIGLEFTRATRGSVKARLTLFGRGGGTEFEQGQELDGGSRCLVLAFRFLPVGAARPESGEYRWLRIERDHANLLSSGAIPSRWIPSALGPFVAGWNTTAGTAADAEHGVNVLAAWSWNGAGSADLAARRLAFEHPTDIELEHPELQESDVPNWPGPVFLLRAEAFP